MEVDGEKYMIIEYTPNGDLYDWLNSHQHELLREDQVIFVGRSGHSPPPPPSC